MIAARGIAPIDSYHAKALGRCSRLQEELRARTAELPQRAGRGVGGLHRDTPQGVATFEAADMQCLALWVPPPANNKAPGNGSAATKDPVLLRLVQLVPACLTATAALATAVGTNEAKAAAPAQSSRGGTKEAARPATMGGAATKEEAEAVAEAGAEEAVAGAEKEAPLLRLGAAATNEALWAMLGA